MLDLIRIIYRMSPAQLPVWGPLDIYGSAYAAWMMIGGHNVPWEDYNPGDVITVVAAFDFDPSDGHIYVMFDCKQVVTIGEWSKIKKGAIKANQ